MIILQVVRDILLRSMRINIKMLIYSLCNIGDSVILSDYRRIGYTVSGDHDGSHVLFVFHGTKC